MIRPQDLSNFRTDFFENLHGLAHIAQWGIFAAVESPRVASMESQDDYMIGPMHPRGRVDPGRGGFRLVKERESLIVPNNPRQYGPRALRYCVLRDSLSASLLCTTGIV